MKNWSIWCISILLASACAFGFRAGFAAADIGPSATNDSPETPATMPAPDFADPQILEAWGWITGNQSDACGADINDEELSLFLKGATKRLRGHPAPFNIALTRFDLRRLITTRREKLVRQIEQKNLQQWQSFLPDLQKNPGIVQLPAGSWCEVINPGSGPPPKLQQTVQVHFVGHLLDGTDFIEMGPIEYVLVPRQNICRDWSDALQKISKGGKLKLYLPPPLPREDATKWGVPPGSALVFEIELLNVRDSTADEIATALVPPAPPGVDPPPAGYTPAQLFETWGWRTPRDTGLPFDDSQISDFIKGLSAGIRRASPPAHGDEIFAAVEKFAAHRQKQARLAFKKEQLAAANAFFAKLSKNPNIVQTASGLRYEILKAGAGAPPKIGQIVYVNFTTRLLDDKIVDQSVDEPLSIELGKYLAGWDEGLQKINKGGRIKLYVPYNLGWGDEEAEGVPAYSTLIFDLELVDIKDKPADEPATKPDKP